MYFMSEPNLLSIEIHSMSGLIQSWRYLISTASSNQRGGLRQWEFRRVSDIPAVGNSPSWVSWDPTHLAGSAENAKLCPLSWGYITGPRLLWEALKDEGAACFRTKSRIAFCLLQNCGFPKLRVPFLWCDPPHGWHIYRHPVSPCETWGLGRAGENILMFTVSAVLQESFVSAPRVSCLPWASTKWQLLSRTKPNPRTDIWQRERGERIESSSSDFCFSLFYPSR